MTDKKIKILFEVPSKWVDYEDPLFGLGSFFSQRLEPMLRDAVVDKAVSQMEIPDIKITKEEIKDRMLTILAERALKNTE